MSSHFNRVLGRLDVFTLSFGAMIGWGWVVLTGTMILKAGVMGAMLAFLIGGLVVTLVGLTYAELTSAMPKVGGEHVFSYRGLGVEASYICTWFIILAYVSICAFEAVALPVVLDNIFPLSVGEPLWHVNGNPIYGGWIVVGVLGSLGMGLINHFGVKTAAILQNLFTALIAIVGLMLIVGSLFSPYAQVSHSEVWDLSKISFGFMPVLVMTPFLLVGFDVIPQAAEEINLPYQQIGKVLIFSVIVAIFWYAAIIFAVGKTLNSEELINNPMATASAMERIYQGAWARNLLIIAGLGGIITSWNSFFVGATRAIFAMGQSDMLPRQFAIVHKKYKTPTVAIIFVTVTSVLATVFGKSAMSWLVNAGGFGIVISWSIVAIAFYQLRIKEPKMPRPFKVKGGKIVGILAFILSLGLAYLYLPGNSSALSVEEWLIILGWVVIGVFMYIIVYQRYGRSEMKNKMNLHLDIRRKS